MGRFLEFAELLEDKIRKEIRASEGVFSSGNALDGSLYSSTDQNVVFDDSPLGMAWLLGKLEKKSPLEKNENKGKSAYGVIARPRPPRKPHILSGVQAEAFAFFRVNNPELDPGFTRRELKAAYKVSALCYHPDRGGEAAKFLALTAHYRTLLTLFT